MLGTHQGLGKGIGIQPPYRARYPPVEVIGGEGGRGHLRTLQVDPRHHLRKRQPPLCQGKHPPAMDGGNHPRGGKPSISQLLQSFQTGLEFLLFLVRGPIAPVAAGGSHHSLRKRREPPIVIPEVKPQGWRGCTVARAPASTRGCSHRPTPPCGPSFPPSSRQKAPRRRDRSTDPSGGQSPKSLHKPPRRWPLARWSWG
jgi:hypothetical protein